MLRLSLYFELHFWKFNALFYFQCSSHLASSISYVLGDWSSVPEAGMWQPADGLLSSCCLHGLLGSLKSLYSRSHSSPCCSEESPSRWALLTSCSLDPALHKVSILCSGLIVFNGFGHISSQGIQVCNFLSLNKKTLKIPVCNERYSGCEQT